MKKYQNIIILAGLVVFFLLINILQWNNFFSSKEAIRGKIDTIDQQIAVAEQIEAADKRYNVLVEPFFEDFFTLKDFIGQTAKDSGLTLYSIRPAKQAGEKEMFSEITISLSLKAPYERLIGFIESLENNPAVGIEQINLQADAADQEVLAVSLTVTGIGR